MMSPSDFSYKQILFLRTKNKEKLSFRNDNIVILDSDGKVIHQSTCYRLFALFVLGHFSITSGLIQRAKKFGFAIILMTDSFRPYHIINDSAEANFLLRKKQYAYQGIGAAKQLISNKIKNQHDALATLHLSQGDSRHVLEMLRQYTTKVLEANSIQEIMGIEGTASRLYFREFFNDFDWNGRKPRIKNDMINALMDIGYTLLFSYLDALASLFGFDRYCGILHRQFYMRKSLICDLVEPFRPLIDHQIRKSIHLHQFMEEDFEIFDKRWCLKYSKSSEYASVFIQALTEHREAIFIYVRDFYRLCMKNEIENHMPEWRIQK